MRRHTGIMTAALAATVAATAAHAQQQQEQDRPQQMQPERMPNGQQMNGMQTMMLHHADDEVINASVTNMQQENLGSIDALVIDLQSEQVVYGVVSFGGFLGIGDEMHVVPWNAFVARPLYDGLVLNVTREQLQRQESFRRDQLPDFGDRQWGQRMHQEYGTRPYWEQRRDRRWMDDDRPRGRLQSLQQPQQQQPPRTPRDPDEPTYPGMETNFVTTYDMIGMTVENRQGENVGTIRDFAFNLQTGEVEYVVMGYGGWLGIAETHTAVPLGAFQPHAFETDNPRMILDITQDQLRGAPEYQMDHWPRRGAANWAENLVTQPARQPGREPARPMR